jgi:hypothetical protein
MPADNKAFQINPSYAEPLLLACDSTTAHPVCRTPHLRRAIIIILAALHIHSACAAATELDFASVKSLDERFGVPFIREHVFGQDYAKTLATWRNNFRAAWPNLTPFAKAK